MEIGKLITLDVERKLEQKRKDLSISLNICPVCDSPIIEERYERYDKPESYLFGLVKIKGYIWDYRMICSKDKKHYENKYNWIRYK